MPDHVYYIAIFQVSLLVIVLSNHAIQFILNVLNWVQVWYWGVKYSCQAILYSPFTIVELKPSFLICVSLRFFHVVAPNTFRFDSDETIAIAVEGKPSAMVNIVIQDHPGKIKKILETRIEVYAEQPYILNVHLNPESFPPSFLTGHTEKFVLLTVSSDNFLKEIQIPVSNQAGYVFIQTDKPIYTPKENAHFRIIPLNENEKPSDKPFKLQIK
ncbi:complement C3, partial [Caerostris extrusa]